MPRLFITLPMFWSGYALFISLPAGLLPFEQVFWNGQYVPRFKALVDEEIELKKILGVSV